MTKRESSIVQRMGLAEARAKLPQIAARLSREPAHVVEVTRRGRPVLHLLAPPRVERHASAARRLLQRAAVLRRETRPKEVDVARRYKRVLYGDD